MHNVLLSNAQLNRWNIAATLINEPNSETRRKTAENGSRAKQKFGTDNFLFHCKCRTSILAVALLRSKMTYLNEKLRVFCDFS